MLTLLKNWGGAPPAVEVVLPEGSIDAHTVVVMASLEDIADA